MKSEQPMEFDYSRNIPEQDEQPMDLGDEWHTHEGDWVGLWRRHGDSQWFDAKWTRRGDVVIGALYITREGNNITVRRSYSSDNNCCDYTGTIAEDGKTVKGHFDCDCHDGNGGPWEGTISWLETTDVGKYWTEEEMGWTGTWELSGHNRNTFNARWTALGLPDVTAVLYIYRYDNNITIHRRDSSDGNNCEYTGILGEDGKTVTGTYNCVRGGGTWSATIHFE